MSTMIPGRAVNKLKAIMTMHTTSTMPNTQHNAHNEHYEHYEHKYDSKHTVNAVIAVNTQ